MQNIVETQHKHVYSLYIGSLCNVAFPKDQKLFMYSLTPTGQDNENKAKLGS